MTSAEKARRFAALHVQGKPLVLYNIWDAGSARAVVDAGASAVATGSWSVAAAHGFEDGEAIPLDFVEMIVRRIAATVDAPVSVDFERGYGDKPSAVAAHAARLMEAGAVGINFEDGLAGRRGLRNIQEQCERIAAIRETANEHGVPLFINARTDIFLQEKDQARHGELLEDARKRGAAYAKAGASGFFVPGLVDEAAIEKLCTASPLPVNVMMMPDAPSIARLTVRGVSRISFGPRPFIALMAALKARAEEIYGPS